MSFWQAGFWQTGFWQAGFWSGDQAAEQPVSSAEQPAGGGSQRARRIRQQQEGLRLRNNQAAMAIITIVLSGALDDRIG